MVAAGLLMNMRPFAGPTVMLNAPLSAKSLPFEDARSVYAAGLVDLAAGEGAKPKPSVFSGFVVQVSAAPGRPGLLIASGPARSGHRC